MLGMCPDGDQTHNLGLSGGCSSQLSSPARTKKASLKSRLFFANDNHTSVLFHPHISSSDLPDFTTALASVA